MQFFIPQKNDYILVTQDIVSSSGCQKLEFFSKKYPNSHSKLTSFVLKKTEWYQIGSIYTLKSNIYMSLRIQKTKSSRRWIQDRIDQEINKISLFYDNEDEPMLKNRSIECLSSDLNKKCFIFSTLKEALDTKALIELNNSKQFKRWENIDSI